MSENSTISYVTMLLITITLFLNVLALWLLWKRTPCTSMRLLLTHLFVSAALNALTYSLPWIILSENLLDEVFVTLFVLNLYFAGMQSLVLFTIATYRFIVVYYPIKSKLWLTTTRTKKDILLMYLINTATFALIVPLIMTNALPDTEVVKAYVLAVMGDCLLIVIVYVSIVIKVLTNRKVQSTRRNNDSTEARLLIFCILITCTHLVSNIPLAIDEFKGEFYGQSHAWMWVDSIATPLFFIVSLLFQGKCLRKRLIKHNQAENPRSSTTKHNTSSAVVTEEM